MKDPLFIAGLMTGIMFWPKGRAGFFSFLEAVMEFPYHLPGFIWWLKNIDR